MIRMVRAFLISRQNTNPGSKESKMWSWLSSIGSALGRFKGLTAWLGSSLGGLVINAFRAVEVKLRAGDVEAVTNILNLVESVCQSVLDTVIYVRGAIRDGKVSGEEAEDLFTMIRTRIKMVDEAKARISDLSK